MAKSRGYILRGGVQIFTHPSLASWSFAARQFGAGDAKEASSLFAPGDRLLEVHGSLPPAGGSVERWNASGGLCHNKRALSI